jgi:hypothetical protein
MLRYHSFLILILALIGITTGCPPSTPPSQKPLTPVAVKPVYNLVRTFGGSGYDDTFKAILDNSGNLLIAGTFQGDVDLDPGPNEQRFRSQYNDIFFSKFDPNGNLVWVKVLSGPGLSDICYSISVDSLNNLYLTGSFSGTIDLDPGSGSFNVTSKGKEDIFAAKYDTNGKFLSGFAWGGIGNDRGIDIDVDSTGNIYICGYFTGTVDFNPGPPNDIRQSNGGQDLFLSKFAPNGMYIWAQTWGSPDVSDSCNSLALDASNAIFVTGTNNNDLFARKFNSDSNLLKEFAWTFEGDQFGWDIIVDYAGNIIITGGFSAKIGLDQAPQPEIHTSSGGHDIFLLKLSGNLDYIWLKTWGGSGIWDEGHGLSANNAGEIFITGRFEDEIDFDPGSAIDLHKSLGGTDVFMSKFDTSGNFKWAVTWGGTGIWDEGHGLAVAQSGNIFIVGKFMESVNFNTGTSTDIRSSNGDSDVFMSKFVSQ